MRVVLVIDRLKPYGAERVCLSLAELLARSDEVILLTYGEDQGSPVTLDPGVRRVQIARPRNKWLALPTILYRITRAMRQLDADVALSFMTLANLICLVTQLFHKVPVVATEHNLLSQTLSKFWVLNWFQRLLVRIYYPRASCCICVSEEVRMDLLSLDGLSGVKAEMVHNPVDVDRLLVVESTAKRELQRIEKLRKRRGGQIGIATVASLKSAKGQDLAIRALTLLSPSFYLMLVGDGPTRQYLHELAAELEVLHRVEFIGATTHPGPWYANAEVVLIPSRYEGFGLVAVEAFALNSTVVGADVHGLREVLAILGLVPIDLSVEKIASAVSRLSVSPQVDVVIPRRLRPTPRDFEPEFAADQYRALLSAALATS